MNSEEVLRLCRFYDIMHLGDCKMFSVIFDMDGTLFDTQRICIPAWDWAGEAQGFKNVGEHIPAVCGQNEAGWTKHLKDHFPTMDVPRFAADAKDYVAQNLVLKYMPGAEELVKFLKSKGVKLAIASGSSRDIINHHLNKVGAKDFFDVAVGGPDAKRGKPAPDIFLLAAEKLGVNPKDCYVLEDSANGIKAAAAVGMKPIGIPDIVQFSDDVKLLETAEFSSMLEALEYFKEVIGGETQ